MKWSIVTIYWLMVFAVFLASNSHAVVYTNLKITPVPQKISTSSFSFSSQFCFGSTLSTGAENIKIWASTDSGGRQIISNIFSTNLSAGASYPARCTSPNTKGEATLLNMIAINNQIGYYNLTLNLPNLSSTCQRIYINFDSNRQGKSNAFYSFLLNDQGRCDLISPTPTISPTMTPLPPGKCRERCSDNGLTRCQAGLYCQTLPNGNNGCFDNDLCKPTFPFIEIPSCRVSPTPSIAPTNEPTLAPSSSPTLFPTSSPTQSPTPTITNIPTDTPTSTPISPPRCNEPCNTSLPLCDKGYFCYTDINPRGTCQNYTDCSPINICLPTPSQSPIITAEPTYIPDSPTPTPLVNLSCLDCLSQNKNFACTTTITVPGQPKTNTCSETDKSSTLPGGTTVCKQCAPTTSRQCNFASKAIVKETLNVNGQTQTLPLMLEKKDIEWFAMNNLQIQKELGSYSPKDNLNGSDNTHGFTQGQIAVALANMNFPIPSTENDPTKRYNSPADKVSVKLFYPEDKFEIVGQFCENNGKSWGCPPEFLQKEIKSNLSLINNFTLDCGVNVEYGWIVKRKPLTEPTRSVSDTNSVQSIPNFNTPLLSQIEGFATLDGGTTGGNQNGSKEVFVTSDLDDPIDPQPGTLRHAASQIGPKIIKFTFSGEIKLRKDIFLNSDTTIDGSGQNITVTQKGLYLKKIRNVILHNFSLRNCKGESNHQSDGININESSNVWIHRMTMSDYCDGLIDIIDGSKNITISWSKFSGHDKAFLISQDDKSPELDKNITVTFHHNWFSDLKQRTPRVRFGKVDMYNNFDLDWTHYAIGSTYDSQILAENNIFEAFKVKKNNLISYKLSEDKNEEDKYFMGFVNFKNNLLIPSDLEAKGRFPENVFTRPYNANVAKADLTLKDILIRFAGSKNN